MSKLISILFCLALGCGAALPAILTGITTAAQLIDVFEHQVSPQYQESQTHCANAIAALPDESVTSVVAACDELVDAYYALAPLIDQLKQRSKDTALFEKAKARFNEYNVSYKKYRADVP